MSQPQRKTHATSTLFDKSVVRQYWLQHRQARRNGLGQLSRTPFSTLITCLVIGIALALPTTLFVLLKNIEILGHNYRDSTQLTVFLKPNTTENEALALVQTLKTTSAIREVHAISPAQGLKELQQQSGIDEVMTDLTNNPLPWTVVIQPIASYRSPADLTKLGEILKQYPAIQSIQLDMMWAQRLAAFMMLAHRFIYALSSFLAIGVLLIIYHCIRSVTQYNKKDISVIQFIGGTDAFIRRPFLYAGMIYGLLGGIIAWQLVDLLLLWLREPSTTLAGLYRSQFQLIGIGMANTFLLLFSSIALGLVGAWLAVNRHLRTPSS